MDFLRKYMQHGFKNKNPGKRIRPTLAIISNPDLRIVMGAAKKKVATSTANEGSNKLGDEDMHTMMKYICRLLVDDDSRTIYIITNI